MFVPLHLIQRRSYSRAKPKHIAISLPGLPAGMKASARTSSFRLLLTCSTCILLARHWTFVAGNLHFGLPATEQCETQKELLVRAIHRGDLSEARTVALETLIMNHHAPGRGCDETTLAKLYQQQAAEMLQLQGNHGWNHEEKIKYHHMNFTTTGRRVQAVVDPSECWASTIENSGAGGDNVMDLWDECCSQVNDHGSAKNDGATGLPQQHGNGNLMFGEEDAHSQCVFKGKPLCCEFHVGSSSYLRLPALRELALRVRVESDDGVIDIYDLEQDGFLRRFDVAGILWPSGYLLALCVAAPTKCGVPELNDIADSSTELFALELGSGIGLPSIALTRMLARRRGNKERQTFRMVAADKARHALALTASNARAANASVSTVLMDHSNETALASTFHAQRFSVILGSALQAFFDESTREKEHPLWKALDQLLDRSEHAIVLLSHATNSLQVPVDGNFERMITISGNRFGMKTRYGEDSDFQISVFRRVNSEAFDQEL